MNLYSATVETIRRFAARRRLPCVIEKRTYVFILVPFDFRGNGDAKRTEVGRNLIYKRSDFGAAQDDTEAGLAAVDCTHSRVSGKTTGHRNLDNEPQLNFDLMWTWFLPNPLWPPKERR
jgi:hypothetical protein